MAKKFGKNVPKFDRTLEVPAFDFNAAYTNPVQRLAAAQAALGRTMLGKGNVIKVDLVDGELSWFVNSTKRSFSSLSEAIDNNASEIEFNEVRNFLPFGKKTGNPLDRARTMLNKFGAADSLFKDVGSKALNLSPSDLKRLSDAGIDTTALKDLTVDLMFAGGSKGDTRSVAERISSARAAGKLHGISILDDKGGRVIQFRQGQTVLDTYQTNLLLSMTGHDLYDSDKILGAIDLDYGNVTSEQFNSAMSKISGSFEKSSKRLRAYFSARDISLSDQELNQIVRKFTGSGTGIENISLILDPQHEMLSRFADQGYDFKYSKNAKGLRGFYKDVDAEESISNILKGFDTQFKAGDLSKFKKAIVEFNNSKDNFTKGSFASDRLKDHLLDKFAKGNKNRQVIIEGLFDNIEKTFDGTDQMNREFLRKYTAQLVNQKKDLLKDISSPSIDPATKNAKLQMIGELEANIKRIDSGELSQITGRGNMFIRQLGEHKNIKTAYDASRNFKDELSQFGLILSKFSLKSDTKIAGAIDSFILSGIGNPRDVVYADPVLTAFHPSLFADEDTLKSISVNARNVAMEYKAAMETGIVPPKIMKMIEHQIDQDVDLLPARTRVSAVRNKEMMKQLHEMTLSGVSPKNQPQLANLLHKFFATQVFQEDIQKDLIKPVLPGVYRFGLATEMSLVGSGQKAVLGDGIDKLVDGIQIDGKNYAKNAELMKYRIEGHKIFLPDSAVGQFHHSLGGFDLDDKGLPKIVTYKNGKGKGRLGTYMVRQPSGTEEVIFARARMDQAGIKALFGDDKFSSTLDEMISSPKDENQARAFAMIRQYLDSEGNAFDDNIAGDIESAIVDVLNKQAEMGMRGKTEMTAAIAKKIESGGASTLRISDFVHVDSKGKAINIVPEYTTNGVYRVLLQDGAFDMSAELKASLKKAPHVDSAIKEKLLGANTMQEMTSILNDYSKSGRANEAASIISGGIEELAISRSKSDSLGNYINRSMIIGSTFDQFEDFIGALKGKDKGLAKHILDTYGIGLLGQESAIDLNVNFSSAKQLLESTSHIAENADSLNPDVFGSTVGKILGSKEAVTTEQIGAEAMRNLGKKIGFIRSLDFGDDMDEGIAKFGVDPLFLRTRAKGDAQLMIQSILEGAQDAEQQASKFGKTLHTGHSEKVQALIKAQTFSDQDASDFLLTHYALDNNSAYAAASKVELEARKAKALLDAVYRGTISNMPVGPDLLAAPASIEEERMADFLVERHKKKLLQMRDFQRMIIQSESDHDILMLSAHVQKVGQTVLEDIGKAAEVKGVAYQGLVNALDRQLNPLGVDIASLRYPVGDTGEIVGEADQIMKRINFAKSVRKTEFLQSFDTTHAQQVFQTLEDLSGTVIKSPESLREAVDNVLANMNEHVPDDVRNTLAALAGNQREIESEAIRQDAELQAAITRSLAESEAYDADDLAAIGDRAGVEMGDEGVQISEDMLQAVNASLQDPPAPLNQPVYKKLAQKMTEDSFKDLIHSGTAKKMAIGIGALVAGSFLYQHHKDRTPEDMQGPPLLPGGSAYETDYPNHIPEIGYSAGDTYNPGITYNVNLYGNQKQIRQFNSAVGGVSNGNMRTTMYNRIPDAGRDPYGSIASSF